MTVSRNKGEGPAAPPSQDKLTTGPGGDGNGGLSSFAQVKQFVMNQPIQVDRAAQNVQEDLRLALSSSGSWSDVKHNLGGANMAQLAGADKLLQSYSSIDSSTCVCVCVVVVVVVCFEIHVAPSSKALRLLCVRTWPLNSQRLMFQLLCPKHSHSPMSNPTQTASVH